MKHDPGGRFLLVTNFQEQKREHGTQRLCVCLKDCVARFCEIKRELKFEDSISSTVIEDA